MVESKFDFSSIKFYLITFYVDLFSDGNDFSYEAIQKGRNKYYQKQLATQLISQINKMISLLTSTLKVHLNVGQNLSVNTPSAFMSLETLSIESLSNKQIQQVGQAKIRLPSFEIDNNQTISLRV